MHRLNFISMLSRRSIAALALAAAWLAALGSVSGFAWYFRSARYRAHTSAELSKYLGLPAEIGRTNPLSLSARGFGDVVVFLPQRRAKIFTCRDARFGYLPPPDDERYVITLHDGHVEISSRTWLSSDYRAIFEAGVRPGFELPGLEAVRFSDMAITLERDPLTLELGAAAGTVRFPTNQTGNARLVANAINGTPVTDPVSLSTTFSQAPTGIAIDNLTLTVPALALDTLTGRQPRQFRLQSGTFSGSLHHREPAGNPVTTVSGTLTEVDIGELTRGWLPQPVAGHASELRLESLELRGGRIARVACDGQLHAVALRDLLQPMGIDPGGAFATLSLQEFRLGPTGIERAVLSGSLTGLDLRAITSGGDWGVATGVVDLAIADLVIVNNRLHRLIADAHVRNPADQDGWIEGRLLQTLLTRASGINLPNWLPDRVHYAELGVRIEVHDEELYLLGTHGPDNQVIMTVLFQEQPLPLIYQPRRPIDLATWLDPLRDQLTALARQPFTHGPAEDANP